MKLFSLFLAFGLLVPYAASEEPTSVIWPGGKMSLGQAVKLLQNTGNTTMLMAGVDEKETRTLPPMNGTYWEALLTLCKNFNLDINPPRLHRVHIQRHSRASAQRRYNKPQFIHVEAGPVQLVKKVEETTDANSLNNPDPKSLAMWIMKDETKKRLKQSGGIAAQRSAHGHYLVEIVDAAVATIHNQHTTRTRAGFSFRVRLEPRWNLDQLGPSHMIWRAVTASNGQRLQDRHERRQETHIDHGHQVFWGRVPIINKPEPTTKPQEPIVKIIHDAPRDLNGIRVQAIIHSELWKDLSVQAILVPGQRKTVYFDGIPLTIFAISDDMAAANGLPHGRLGLIYPTTENGLSNRLQLTAYTTSGSQVEIYDYREESAPQPGHTLRYYFGENIGKNIYKIVISASLVDITIDNPIEFTLELP